MLQKPQQRQQRQQQQLKDQQHQPHQSMDMKVMQTPEQESVVNSETIESHAMPLSCTAGDSV